MMIKQMFFELPRFSYRTFKHYNLYNFDEYMKDHFNENEVINIQVTNREEDQIEYVVFYNE